MAIMTPRHTPRTFAGRPGRVSTIEYRPEAQSDVEAAALDAVRAGSDAVIDLDPRPELETSDFRFLIRLLRRCRELGGVLALRTTRSQHFRMLQVTGLDSVFPIAFRGGRS